MKKILLTTLILSLFSCGTEPIDNYCGGVIIGKRHKIDVVNYSDSEFISFVKIYGSNGWGPMKYNNEKVYLTEYDYNSINIGDTISNCGKMEVDK